MANIVLGIGSSHTPLLSIPGDRWEDYAQGDRRSSELIYPPQGIAMSFEEGAKYVSTAVREKPRSSEIFVEQQRQCTEAIEDLAATWEAVAPDITVIVSDDQAEWFFENNMPALAVFWGDSAPIIPTAGIPGRGEEINRYIASGYGLETFDVPIAADLGRHVIEHLMDHDFDVAQMRYVDPAYGGAIKNRFPSPSGAEIGSERVTPPRAQGLPHGYAYVVTRLFHSKPSMILPIIQNTCYAPNNVTPKRAYHLGRALADAIASWPEDARIAVVASGGLSHTVVDEELDRGLLTALAKKDGQALASQPRERLRGASSESLNWVTVGGVMEDTPYNFEYQYIPVYRTEAGTGGGWAFGKWL